MAGLDVAVDGELLDLQLAGRQREPNNLPNCGGQYGKITVNDVPAGARVWVTVHLDFALKDTTQPQSITLPKNYGPFKSDITIKHQQTGLVLGTSTSQTSLLGRGKKVTVVYGTTVNLSGNAVGGVWMKVQQGTGPPSSSEAMSRAAST